MRIAIVYSLPSSRIMATEYGETDEDSKVIANKVKLGLEAKGHEVAIYPIHETKIQDIATIKAEMIFNLIEWCGLDIELAQRAFAQMRKLMIPITGSSEELFVLTGDKVRLKEVLLQKGFQTPEGQYFTTGDEAVRQDLHYPLIVKPAYEHCSTGLSRDSLARDVSEVLPIVQRQIDKFGQVVIAEEFIVGRELLVYLVADRHGVTVLPVEEVIFSNHDPLAFQTYESKWIVDHPDYQTTEVVVAKLARQDQEIVEKMSKKIFQELGFGGYARFDVRLKDHQPYFLECNANPSVYDGDGSLSDPDEEVIMGIKFSDYLEKIVESAIEVFEDHQTKKTVDNQ